MKASFQEGLTSRTSELLIAACHYIIVSVSLVHFCISPPTRGGGNARSHEKLGYFGAWVSLQIVIKDFANCRPVR